MKLIKLSGEIVKKKYWIFFVIYLIVLLYFSVLSDYAHDTINPFDLVVFLLTVFMTLVTIIRILQFILKLKNDKIISRLKNLFLFLFFTSFSWFVLICNWYCFINKSKFNPTNEEFVVLRLRKCVLDAGTDYHFCKNILIFTKPKQILSSRYVVDFQPEGKSMSIKDGLIYFHQEGCCEAPDLITAIDGMGKIIKTCHEKTRPKLWGKPVTKENWQKYYHCSQRICEKNDYCDDYGDRDKKLRGQ